MGWDGVLTVVGWYVVGMLAYKGEAILGDTIYSKHSYKLFITITIALINMQNQTINTN